MQNTPAEIPQLENVIAKLANTQDKQSQEKWRLKRGKLAQLYFEQFNRLKDSDPFHAVQLLYKAGCIGYQPAVDHLNNIFHSPPSTNNKEQPNNSNMVQKDYSPEEIFFLGLTTLLGIGKDCNPTKAVQYFTIAAKSGHAGAQNYLAKCYISGVGISMDYDKAKALWISAAKQDDANAKTELADLYSMDEIDENHDAEIKTFNYLAAAANQGYAVAQFELGNCYEYGLLDLKLAPNTPIAMQCWTFAAQQGHIDAQFKLGEKYFFGYANDIPIPGLPFPGHLEHRNNLPLGILWLRKAAECAHTQAQIRLGQALYQPGEYQNKNEAIRWWTLAAEQNDYKAKAHLAKHYLHLFEEETTDLMKKKELFVKSLSLSIESIMGSPKYEVKQAIIALLQMNAKPLFSHRLFMGLYYTVFKDTDPNCNQIDTKNIVIKLCAFLNHLLANPFELKLLQLLKPLFFRYLSQSSQKIVNQYWPDFRSLNDSALISTIRLQQHQISELHAKHELTQQQLQNQQAHIARLERLSQQLLHRLTVLEPTQHRDSQDKKRDRDTAKDDIKFRFRFIGNGPNKKVKIVKAPELHPDVWKGSSLD